MNPEISVILPVYNGGSMVKEAIESVLKQDFDNFEFLICDDCSTDESHQSILTLTKGYPNVKCFKNQTNKGLFKTLNFLITNTTACLIHLWSQDDIMRPQCLAETVKFHQEHPELAMSYSGRDYINERGELFELYQKDGTPAVIDSALYAKISVYWGCIAGNIANVTLSKHALDQCGLFDESMRVSGDYEMWTRLAKHAPIGFINKPLILLRRHSGQLSRSLTSIYFSIKEDIPVILDTLSMVAPQDKKKATTAWKWRTHVMYFNEILFLIYNRKFDLALKCLKLVSAQTNIFLLSIRWTIIRIFRILKKDRWFYNSVLNTLN